MLTNAQTLSIWFYLSTSKHMRAHEQTHTSCSVSSSSSPCSSITKDSFSLWYSSSSLLSCSSLALCNSSSCEGAHRNTWGDYLTNTISHVALRLNNLAWWWNTCFCSWSRSFSSSFCRSWSLSSCILFLSSRSSISACNTNTQISHEYTELGWRRDVSAAGSWPLSELSEPVSPPASSVSSLQLYQQLEDALQTDVCPPRPHLPLQDKPLRRVWWVQLEVTSEITLWMYSGTGHVLNKLFLGSHDTWPSSFITSVNTILWCVLLCPLLCSHSAVEVSTATGHPCCPFLHHLWTRRGSNRHILSVLTICCWETDQQFQQQCHLKT